MNDDYLSIDESVEYLNISRPNQIKFRPERLLEDALSGLLPVYGRYFPRQARWRIGKLIARTDSEAQANSGRESSVKPIDHVGSPLLSRRIVERERQFLAYSTEVLEFSDEQVQAFIKTELAPSTTSDQQPNPTISRAEAAKLFRESIAAGVEVVEHEAINDPVQLCVAGAVADHIEARIRSQQASPVDIVVATLGDDVGGVLYDGKKPCRGWPDGARLVFRRDDLDGLVSGEPRTPDENIKPHSKTDRHCCSKMQIADRLYERKSVLQKEILAAALEIFKSDSELSEVSIIETIKTRHSDGRSSAKTISGNGALEFDGKYFRDDQVRRACAEFMQRFSEEEKRTSNG